MIIILIKLIQKLKEKKKEKEETEKKKYKKEIITFKTKCKFWIFFIKNMNSIFKHK